MKTFIQSFGGMLQIVGLGFAITGTMHLIGLNLDDALMYGILAFSNTVVGLLLTELS